MAQRYENIRTMPCAEPTTCQIDDETITKGMNLSCFFITIRTVRNQDCNNPPAVLTSSRLLVPFVFFPEPEGHIYQNNHYRHFNQRAYHCGKGCL